MISRAIVVSSVLLSIFFGGEWVFAAESTSLPPSMGYSGMAHMGENRFLVVHDTKKGNPEPRLGVILIESGSLPAYSSVTVKDWGHSDRPASDLESACAIPDKKLEFLVSESGQGGKKNRRIFHIRLLLNEVEGWLGVVEGVIKLPKDTDNIEGLACLAAEGDSMFVVLGERGGTKNYPQGKLRWGRLDLKSYTLNLQGEQTFAAPDWPEEADNRDCSDLYIDEENNLWISAAEDPGNDGPFRSVIYNAGKVDPEAPNPIWLDPERAWIVEGLKVEAIGAPVVEGSALSMATDDENYGGIWRPLFPN